MQSLSYQAYIKHALYKEIFQYCAIDIEQV